MTTNTIYIATYSIVLLAVAISVVTDLKTRKIKDFITFPAILLILLVRILGGGWGTLGGSGLLGGLVGLVLGGVVFFPFAYFGKMGMGDVKLMAVVGAGVGLPNVLLCLFGVGVAGGVQAVLFLIWKGKFLLTLENMGKRFLKKANFLKKGEVIPESEAIPYGVAIAAGALWGMWISFEKVFMASV